MSTPAWANPLRYLTAFRPPDLAPDSLSQPIQPWNLGTVLNFTTQNSTAPDTEAAILEKQSYGRQIGRIADALEELLAERTVAGGATKKPFTEFLEIQTEIKEIKAEAAKARTEQVRKDLLSLKEHDEKAYRKLRAELLDALGEDPGRP